MSKLNLAGALIFYLLYPIDFPKFWKGVFEWTFLMMIVGFGIFKIINTNNISNQRLAYSPQLPHLSSSSKLPLNLNSRGYSREAKMIYEDLSFYDSPTLPDDFYEASGVIFPKIQLEAKLQKIEEYLLTHPTSRDLWVLKMETLQILGRASETKEIMDKLMTIDPNHPKVKSF